MNNIDRCVAISEKIASGALSVRNGATEILNLIHENRAEAAYSMADALWNASKSSDEKVKS